VRFPNALNINLTKIMKLIRILTLAITATTLTLTSVSCREKGPGEKIGDKVDDALDARPGEPIRDAVEKVTE
jgi:hypothetical protein